MSDISFREMQVIEAIARLNSFSDAAQELGITQSAISHTISTVEDRLKITLFTRFKNTVHPTNFALPILKQYESIHTTFIETQRDLNGSTIEGPGLKIQTGFRSSVMWLTPALANLVRMKNLISFDIRIDLIDCHQRLSSGKTDLVLSSSDLFMNESDFAKIRIGAYQNNFVLRFGHPLTNRQRISHQDLMDYPLIGDPIVVATHNEFLKHSGRWGYYEIKENIFYPTIRLRSLNDVIEILKVTDGIGLLPKELLLDKLKNNDLSILNVEDHTEKTNEIFAYYRKSSQNNKLLNALIEELAREGQKTNITESPPSSLSNKKQKN